ncbi:hypothetical protein N305_06838, partial [Manacus vitellinus]
VDVLLFENSNLLLLLCPLQRLVQPVVPKAPVVLFKVPSFQNQPEPRGFGHIHLLLSPAALQDGLSSITLHDGYHQPDHLPDLVHHEALTFHFDHCKLHVLPDKGLSTVHLHDVPPGTGVPGALLGREVVEVVCPFIAREQFVDPVEGLFVQPINLFLHSMVLVGKGKCWQHV